MRITRMRTSDLPAKRKLVLEALRGRTDHPSAEQLYQALVAAGHKVSLATVYRALDALVKEGLVREVHLGGATRFDGTTEGHHHFICHRCGRVYDVNGGRRLRPRDFSLPVGFSAERCHAVLGGVCGPCAGEKGGTPWRK